MLPHHSQISHHSSSWHQQKALLYVNLVVKNQRKVHRCYNCWTYWKTLSVLLIDQTTVNAVKFDFHSSAAVALIHSSVFQLSGYADIHCSWGMAVCCLRLAALTENASWLHYAILKAIILHFTRMQIIKQLVFTLRNNFMSTILELCWSHTSEKAKFS